jgi:hypothetical protein
MDKIKTFYRSLNVTRQYQKQYQHFKDLNTMDLSKLIEAHHVQSFCMIGAGNLEDFHIKPVFSLLSRVLLTDIDKKSVDDAVEKADVAHSNLQIKQVEYTGVQQTKLLDSFELELSQRKSVIEVEQFINQMITKLNKTSFLDDEKGKFDLVYISPIYTQLLFYPLTMVLDEMIRKGFSKALGEQAKSSLLQGMVAILSHFNQTIQSLIKNQGLLVVLSDVFELKHTDEMFQTIEKNIDDFDKIERIYQDYVNSYGMGLGDYGLYDVSSHMKTVSSEWIVWPKNNSESYIVKRLVLSK